MSEARIKDVENIVRKAPPLLGKYGGEVNIYVDGYLA